MPTALIVGAGIGGLATAIAVRGAGWDVRVLEKAASPRELGFALLLAPNAMHALRALGVADRVLAGGVVADVGEMRRPDGTVLRRTSLAAARGILGAPAVVALRPVVHGALLEAAGPAALSLGSAATRVVAEGDGVVVTTEDGAVHRGDLVIGADGVGSIVRRHLHPDEPPPRASGLWALRGVTHGMVAHLDDVTGSQYFGRGIEAGVAQASADAIYWYLSLPASLVAAGSREPRAVLQRAVGDFHATFREIVMATRPEDLRLDELVERDPLARWGTGRMTLVGDAAHPMLPHAGQGAAQALEDAVALGRALAQAADVEQALRGYERIRQPRAARVVNAAKRNARMSMLSGRVSTWLRDALFQHIPERLILKTVVDMGWPSV